jgi:hypothetical protein
MLALHNFTPSPSPPLFTSISPILNPGSFFFMLQCKVEVIVSNLRHTVDTSVVVLGPQPQEATEATLARIRDKVGKEREREGRGLSYVC